MNLQEALNQARERLNRQLLERFQITGQKLLDYEVDARLSGDGETLILVLEMPDGYVISTGVGNFVKLIQEQRMDARPVLH